VTHRDRATSGSPGPRGPAGGSTLVNSLLLVLLPAAPFLGAPWNGLAVALLGGVWLRLGAFSSARARASREGGPPPDEATRRAGRERVLAAILVGAAVLCLLAPWGIERAVVQQEEMALAGALEEGWTRLWAELDAEAKSAAELVDVPARDDSARLQAFHELASLATETRGSEGRRSWGRPTLLLADPDGEAVAWAGEGLLHEPEAPELISEGHDVSASFGSVTLIAVEPLGEGRRRWRVVAGRSFRTDRLPFALPAVVRVRLDAEGVRWSAARPGTPLPPGAQATAPEGLPMLVWYPPEEIEEAVWPWERTERRAAWAVLAILILGATVVRGVRILLPRTGSPGGERVRWPALTLVVGAGLASAALAGGAAVAAAGTLFGGFTLVAAAVAGARSPGREGGTGQDAEGVGEDAWWRLVASFVLGALGTLALIAGQKLLLDALGPTDLASRMWAGVAGAALRTGVGAGALAVLLAARRPLAAGDGAERRGVPGRWLGAALALLLAGAAAHDLGWPAVALLAAAGGAGAVWAGRRSLLPVSAAAMIVVLAAGLGAAGWETVDRLELARTLGGATLEGMAPPEQPELDALAEALRHHFAGVDLADLVPRDPEGLEREDLAFTLWRQSPLVRPNSLSALVIEPLSGAPSVFAFGPPVAPGAGADPEDWVIAQWGELSLPAWDETQIAGETTVRYAGLPWGIARYWLLPRPGFSLGVRGGLDALELGLLRRRSVTELDVVGLPEPAAYGLYGRSGRAVISPWPEAPPLPAALRDGSATVRAVVDTPDGGRSWAWNRSDVDGVEVLYLPVLEPLAALERVGAHAVGNLLVLAAAAGLMVLIALPRPAFRDLLRRTLRSYSKRLMVVLTLLVLLPLFLFNLVVLSDAEERMRREQRASGEAALASAQRVIGDYVASLEPGFGFTTLVDDELLMWLSRVVHHQVNLYWGSSIWASSKPELFAAGLLPERIPGEIYSRLTLLRYDRAVRTNRTGSAAYLEIYAPLRIPGGPADQERLLLSMPLLAQQQEVSEELGLLRRRAVLVSTVLFGLLIAVGMALARRFTEPIEELVEGTRRIAAGAPSLELAPRELELAALVEAVDAMARRIAESRERLVREKQVVERMVENITSGVVSLDRDRRVLMHNRVARDLLGVRVGERIDAALAAQDAAQDAAAQDAGGTSGGAAGEPGRPRRGRLEPLTEFLAGVGAAPERPARATVRLPGLDDGEEREWSLVWVPVPGAGEPTALLVVEDATEVLRSQRLQAWAEMARIIAHEIKNPLTPLRLSTEHMREVFRDGGSEFEEVFERCTRNILSQVEELRAIASEFSTFSSIPRIEPRAGDLVPSMAALVDAYRSAARTGVDVVLERGEEPVETRFDERLLGRAVRNLIENALRASGDRGRVVVRVAREGDMAAVAVRDEGPGVAPELLPRIFDPNFSTHDTGTGLGLPIARRIAEEHGGSITARNRPGGGLEVTIRIPL